jgi:hypothetical protein
MTPVCQAETRSWFSPRLQIVAATCACAAASAYIYSVDPMRGGYPTCLLYRTTGIYCAGCGATRALHALLHGQIVTAVHDNLLFMTLLPVAFVLTAIYAWKAWKQDAWPAVVIGQSHLIRTGLGLVLLMAAFMAVRNIPGAPFDLLRPLG